MMYVHTHLQVGHKRTQTPTPAPLRIIIISRAFANKKGHSTSLLPLNHRLLCCFMQCHIAIGTFGSTHILKPDIESQQVHSGEERLAAALCA